MTGPLRLLTAGESHGPALTAIVEGMPAGLPVTLESVDLQLRRRQAGYGRGQRMRIEEDRAEILSGVRHGVTIGSPIAMVIENRDHARWSRAMSVNRPSEDSPGKAAKAWRERPVTAPRPGHADLAGALKFGFEDVRPVLERASARETAARVAAGALARQLLSSFGITVWGHVVAIGGVACGSPREEEGADWAAIGLRAEESPVRCADPEAGRAMMEAIDRAREDGDTLGGVFEVAAVGVMPGLGSYTHWDRRLDARLAGAFVSIPGVKGVEIGAGFEGAARRGSDVHDPIARGTVPLGQWAGRPGGIGLYRSSNRAGGIEGGVTTGQPVVLRAAMKPLSTLMRPLLTVDLRTGEPARAAIERSDVCAVPSAVVVGEAVLAWVLADALLEKFGHDAMDQIRAAVRAYQEELARRT